MIRALKRLDEKIFGRMSQETFNLIMNTIIVTLLVALFIHAMPKAFDAWYEEHYIKPAKEAQKIMAEQKLHESQVEFVFTTGK